MFLRMSLACLAFSALASCSSPETVSDADKANIDCLSAKTVVEITNAAKAAIRAGQSSEQLQKLQSTIIETGAETLNAKYPSDMHEAYYEYEANRRLTAMQNAVANRAPDSPDQKTMDETIDLAKTCTF